MPVDATGTVTTKFGIPKYATGADAPSGKGLNNIMDSLDTILSNLGIGSLTANDVPVYDSVAGKWKKATGTHDGTKFLRDDGTWVTPTAGLKYTTSTWAGGPPGSPADTDVWIATAVDANGTRWAFQYNAGSASAFKWEFLGGAPVLSGTNGTGVSVSTSFVADPGITYTVGRGGDYYVCGFGVGASNTSTWTVGIGVGTQTISRPMFFGYGGSGSVIIPFEGYLPGLSATNVIQLYLTNNVGAISSPGSSLFSVIPRRIS